MSDYPDIAWGSENLKRDFQNMNLDHSTSMAPEVALGKFRKLVNEKLPAESFLTNSEILRFLKSRKMDPDEAFDTFSKFKRMAKDQPDLFDINNINSPEVIQALEDGLPGVLRCRDRKGRRIIVLFAAQWDENRYDLKDIHKALLLTLNHLLNDLVVQDKGIVIIIDWTGFTFRQCSKLDISALRRIVESVEYGYPVRFKAVHYVGQSWFVETALSLLKPFLRMQSRERIHYHGNNLSSLHQVVPKDILPDELGGDRGPYQASWWLDSLPTKPKSLRET